MKNGEHVALSSLRENFPLDDTSLKTKTKEMKVRSNLNYHTSIQFLLKKSLVVVSKGFDKKLD